jgi:hypothetical protein
MDEFFEMGNVPKNYLFPAEVEKIKEAVASQIAVAGLTSLVLYAPTGAAGPAPAIPTPAASTRRRRRQLLQTGALTIVVRFFVPAASLPDASQNIGAGFGSGGLLTAVRTALGGGYEETTVRSTASKQSHIAADGTAKLTVATGRISNQLVAPDRDPCNIDYGGCHGLVSCTADPSNPFTGVKCGACPVGYTGDGLVPGVNFQAATATGCNDSDECTDTGLVNGGCSPLVMCSNTMGGRTCGACPAGYEGDGVVCADVNECARSNGGCDTLATCANTVGGRECGACPVGYKGSGATVCKRESACANNNGGCDPLTTCGDTGTGGSSCGPCPAGYVGSGTDGCVEYDACAAEGCAAGVHCEDDKAPLMTRKCGPCPPGQLGDGITCKANPCFLKNGGCDALTACSATAAGDAVCGACPSGYERLSAADQFSACSNIDGCAAEPCYAGVLCTDVPPPAVGRICGTCPMGYEGDGATCVDINECAANNGGCDTNTACINVPGSAECGPCPDWALGSGKTGCKPKTTCAVNNGGCDPVVGAVRVESS